MTGFGFDLPGNMEHNAYSCPSDLEELEALRFDIALSEEAGRFLADQEG